MHNPPASAAPVLRLPSLGRDAGAIAAELVLLYQAIDGLPDKVSRVQQTTERSVAARGGDAAIAVVAATATTATIAAVAHDLARAIDADGSHHDRLPYHNRQHFCEVMLAVELLCRVHRVAPAEAQLVLLAALIHDLDHDGEPSCTFRLERHSLQRAAPFLARAGVEPVVVSRLAALVLATQPTQGTRAALDARAFHVSGAALRPPPEEAPELAELGVDAGLARLALLLCEADLLPSVALTFAHALQLQDRLAREWRRPLGAMDKLLFQRDVLANGLIGPFFLPNALAIRLALVERIDEPRAR